MERNKAKIVAYGTGTEGKIVVTTQCYRKEIPAVLFSNKDANALLRLVDKVEAKRQQLVAKLAL